MSEQKKPTAVCSQCQAQTPYDVQERPVEGQPAVTEFVVVCAVCGHAVHSCWSNAVLDKRRREIDAEHHPIRQARLIRSYKRKFDEFQAVMDKRPAPAPEAAA